MKSEPERTEAKSQAEVKELPYLCKSDIKFMAKLFYCAVMERARVEKMDDSCPASKESSHAGQGP